MEISELDDALKVGGKSDITRKKLIEKCKSYIKGSIMEFDGHDMGTTLAVILTSNQSKFKEIKYKLSKVDFELKDWEDELCKAVVYVLEEID